MSENVFIPKAGDLVELKSGGVPMTVERRVDPARDNFQNDREVDCLCVWMNAAGDLQCHWFPDVVLRPAPLAARAAA